MRRDIPFRAGGHHRRGSIPAQPLALTQRGASQLRPRGPRKPVSPLVASCRAADLPSDPVLAQSAQDNAELSAADEQVLLERGSAASWP
jgi:hypothetical protein